MKICVSGWYYRKDLLKHLKYQDTYIVGNRIGECDDIPCSFIHHDQYEWGNYNYYLMNIWNGGDVLFMHDDIIVKDDRIFNIIEDACLEITFISTPLTYAINSKGKKICSGRIIYIEDFILNLIKKKGGFPINKTKNLHMTSVLFMDMIGYRYNHFITEDFEFLTGEWYKE